MAVTGNTEPIPIKRIEKDFLLGNAMYNDRALKCIFHQKEYTFFITELGKEKLILSSKTELKEFAERIKIDLTFVFDDTVIAFNVRILENKKTKLVTTAPESLFRNLVRKNERVPVPDELHVRIKKERAEYVLNYAKTSANLEYFEHAAQSFDAYNADILMNEHRAWFSTISDGYAVTLFKQKRPAAWEELALNYYGKIFFFSYNDGGFIGEKQNKDNFFITEPEIKQFIMNNAGTKADPGKTMQELVLKRTQNNIVSDCFVPIIFIDYIIGYIHIWVNGAAGGGRGTAKKPFTIETVEKIKKATLIFAWVYERNGLFAEGKREPVFFNAEILDISPGGFRFVRMRGRETDIFLEGDMLDVEITIKERRIKCRAGITTGYSDIAHSYYRCKFEEMELEDVRFLYEYLYGKPYTGDI
jgi:hypothetical protein